MTKKNFVTTRRKAAAILAALFFSLCLSACANGRPGENDYTFVDATGRTAFIPYNPTRVVSLLGSFADVWACAGGTLVGVTDDVVEENRVPLSNGMQIVGTVKKPNLEKILALNPDFVLLSADIASHVSAAPTLKKSGIPYAFFKVEKFSDYLEMLKICTTLTGQSERYETYGAAVKTRVNESVARVKDKGEKQKVLFLRVYSTGAKAKADEHIVTYILDDFGCSNIARGQSSLLENAFLSGEIVIAADPDYILATSMGDEEKAALTFSQLLATDAYKGLRCVKNQNYKMLEKTLFHYKPNARWGEAYEILEKVLFE